MKISSIFLIVGLAIGLKGGLIDAKAQTGFSAVEIQSVRDFEGPLSAYGTWVDVAPYGHCWQPTKVPAGWRPYTNGSWEWTDLGWYWASDEPWAWACYHYGTWVYDNTLGWLWVPGTEWAPAWVAWREGPDFIGWAPCTLGSVVLAPSLFVFVDIHHFHRHIDRDILIVNDEKIIQRTRLVNNLKHERRSIDGFARTVIIDPGPAMDPIQRATGRKFNPRPIGEAMAQTPIPSTVKRSAPARGEIEIPSTPTGREQPPISPSAPQRGTGPHRVMPVPPENPAPMHPRPLPPTGREPGMNRGNPMPMQPSAPPQEQRPPARGRERE